MSPLTEQEADSLGKAVTAGTEWSFKGARRLDSSRDGWEAMFRHRRGDFRTASWLDSTPAETVVRLFSDCIAEELPFPDWRPGEPLPSFKLHVPYVLGEMLNGQPQALDSFQPGMEFVVTAVDAEAQTVTLVPKLLMGGGE